MIDDDDCIEQFDDMSDIMNEVRKRQCEMLEEMSKANQDWLDSLPKRKLPFSHILKDIIEDWRDRYPSKTFTLIETQGDPEYIMVKDLHYQLGIRICDDAFIIEKDIRLYRHQEDDVYSGDEIYRIPLMVPDADILAVEYAINLQEEYYIDYWTGLDDPLVDHVDDETISKYYADLEDNYYDTLTQ